MEKEGELGPIAGGYRVSWGRAGDGQMIVAIEHDDSRQVLFLTPEAAERIGKGLVAQAVAAKARAKQSPR